MVLVDYIGIFFFTFPNTFDRWLYYGTFVNRWFLLRHRLFHTQGLIRLVAARCLKSGIKHLAVTRLIKPCVWESRW